MVDAIRSMRRRGQLRKSAVDSRTYEYHYILHKEVYSHRQYPSLRNAERLLGLIEVWCRLTEGVGNDDEIGRREPHFFKLKGQLRQLIGNFS